MNETEMPADIKELERRERRQTGNPEETRQLRMERLRVLAATRGPWALQIVDVLAIQWALDRIAELEADP